MTEFFKNSGFCPICESETEFRAYSENYRSSYICIKCHSRPRHRALMHVIQQFFPLWRDLKIHESSPGPMSVSEKLKKECAKYLPTQFDASLRLGVNHPAEGWRNENLQCQTFDDGEFDLVVTQDVFEHVFNPDLAIKEIARTLKPGGAHIATVPLVCKTKPSRRRALLTAGGTIIYLLPARYHDNPINPQGSLVTIDWGFDIANYFDSQSGLNTTIVFIDNINLGIRADLIEVLVSIKQNIPCL